MATMLITLGALAGPANAESPIEGIWSFTGGKVGITGADDGHFVGTVVSPTKLAQCTHPVSEQIWTQIRPQPDGSYWGLHQWFFATDDCIANPSLGLTAFRVLEKNRARYLRVCLSEPGSTLQPTIAADGTSANATFGCVDSGRISSLPTNSKASLARYLRMPKNAHCIAGKKMMIRLTNGQADPLVGAEADLRSGKLKRQATIRDKPFGKLAKLRLVNLPKRRFMVRVKFQTVLGNELTAKRRYRLCPSGGQKD